VPSAPLAATGPSVASSGVSSGSSSSGAATGVPSGLGRIAAMAAAGLAVLAFLATFLTSFDASGLLPALVLGGGLTVGVAVLPGAPRTVLPGAVLTVTAALVSLQTLAVSDGFDVVVVVLAVLTAAAGVVAALSAVGLVAGGRTAPSGAAGQQSFTDQARPSRQGGGAPAGPDPGPPSGSFASPGEQPTHRVGPGGPPSAPQHAVGPQGPGQRPWAPMSFSPAGRSGDPSGDDPAARTQVVHRAGSSATAGPAGAEGASGGPAATRDPSASGAIPAPSSAAPLTDGRTAPPRGPGRDETAGPRPDAGADPTGSSATMEERQPAMSMLGGESPSERRDDGSATPPSGEPAARSATGTSAPDGSGDATPPSGFPRPTGWGAPADGSESGSDAEGRERPGAHEAP
jgi:hypothetical protein